MFICLHSLSNFDCFIISLQPNKLVHPVPFFQKRTMISSKATNCDTAGTTVSISEKWDEPQSMDVILGRGKSHNKRPGNMVFQGKQVHLPLFDLVIDIVDKKFLAHLKHLRDHRSRPIESVTLP